MNREDIIRMAREAGATPYTNRHYPERPTHTFTVERLERFVALVAAAEREACAKVAEEYWEIDGTHTAKEFAAAIRVRAQE